jgi:ferredoxin
MIVGDRKPFAEIIEMLGEREKVLILGCGTCVSVCMAGGEKEVGLLASQLRMASRKAGKKLDIAEATIQRQCDREYIEPIMEKAREYGTVLSMACGAGVQLVAAMMEEVPILPALNTRFVGYSRAEGEWAENCRLCGDCRLGDYGGICPVTVCAKGLLNGPCGGSSNGKCEADPEKDCAWVLIYNRLKKQGQLDNLRSFRQPRNHFISQNPLVQVNEAYQKPVMENSPTT